MNQEKAPSQQVENFRKEIASYHEREKSGDLKSGHFLKIGNDVYEFDVNDLLPEDMEIWEKVKNGSIDKNDVNAYREKISELFKSDPNSRETSSRFKFMAFLANKASMVIFKKHMGELD